MYGFMAVRLLSLKKLSCFTVDGEGQASSLGEPLVFTDHWESPASDISSRAADGKSLSQVASNDLEAKVGVATIDTNVTVNGVNLVFYWVSVISCPH